MSIRTLQREATRERIVSAAAPAFAETGFQATSTRDIATRAKVNQGLITYYFENKENLWKAAMDHIFAELGDIFLPIDANDSSTDPREQAREAVRNFVRFSARYPAFFQLMVDEGKHDSARLRWLVDKHLKPKYRQFSEILRKLNPEIDPSAFPHLFYMLAGSSGLMFAVRSECRRLTGLDPARTTAVEAHADLIANVLVP